ncbi:hypothetical protein [Streptomyces sp. NPDC058954]|uniref:hypothetical protein n=1 Tax=Streptomyces sp. NPDC058954 TaxID=3346677 RepID=UPI0036B354C4
MKACTWGAGEPALPVEPQAQVSAEGSTRAPVSALAADPQAQGSALPAGPRPQRTA